MVCILTTVSISGTDKDVYPIENDLGTGVCHPEFPKGLPLHTRHIH